MPELPDVEIFSRLVRSRFLRRRIVEARASDPGIVEGISAKMLERQLAGKILVSSRRHGKHLFLVLNEAGALTMHFGTNGSLQGVPSGGEKVPYTRLRLSFENGEDLAYVNPRRIGRVGLCESPESYVAKSGLGPDVLDRAFDLDDFVAILRASRRDIKSVLMDQTRMAGIGNIYSDEILFQARTYPGERADQLPEQKAAKLFRVMRQTLETAIACHAGSEQEVAQLPGDFLLPQRHRGGNCPRCGASLATVKRGGRTSYYCPGCQPG